MIEARLRHQYAHAPTPGPKTEQPLAIPPSAPAKNGSAALRTALSSPNQSTFIFMSSPFAIQTIGSSKFLDIMGSLATGPSADTPKPAASPSGYAAEMTHCHTRLKVAFAFRLIFA